MLFLFKCGLASKAGLRHLSWNNSGGSATAGIGARTTTEESINYKYHPFFKVKDSPREDSQSEKQLLLLPTLLRVLHALMHI